MTSAQWSRSVGAISSSRDKQEGRVGADQIEQWVEALERQQLGDVGVDRPAPRPNRGSSAIPRCSSASSAAGATSMRSSVSSERCVNVEKVRRDSISMSNMLHANRPFGRRGEEIEQAAAHRELAAVLDLGDPLVAHLDEGLSELVEVQELADGELDRARSQRRVGHLLRQCGGRCDEHRRPADGRPRAGRRGRASRAGGPRDRAGSGAARQAPRCADRQGAAAVPDGTRR